MSFEIIDEELRVATCKQEYVPATCGDVEKTVLFYAEEQDLVVFNAEHPYYELFCEWVRDYMRLKRENRKAFLEYIKGKESIVAIFDVVDKIIDARQLMQERNAHG